MKEYYPLFADFMREHGDIFEKNETFGEYIHKNAGPLDDKTRWLVKVGISAASRHQNALGTHISRARDAGATEEEIFHTLALVIPTCGFPTFMEAFRVYKEKES